MPINGDGFNSSISMPPELKVIHIRKAIDFVEKEADLRGLAFTTKKTNEFYLQNFY